MKNKLTCTQAYKIMHHFLDMMYFETYDDELGGFLGSAVLYAPDPDECPQTMDAAIWDDWMDAVKAVVADDSITYDFQVTIDQAYAAVHQYFVTYCSIGSGPSFETLRDLTDVHCKHSELAGWLLLRWQRSVDFCAQDDSIKKMPHLFTGKTELTERDAFDILRAFLDALCQRTHDVGLILLVQNSRLKEGVDYWALVPNIIEPEIWNIWQQSIHTVLLQKQDAKLNALSAYKAIPLFLMNYFESNRSVCIETMVTEFAVQDDTLPQLSFYWRNWMSALVKENGRRIGIMNNLIAIDAAISQDSAYAIIQAWFAEYEYLLGVNLVEGISLDTLTKKSIFQQEVTSIQQKQRSYLLLNDEVTIAETYDIMLQLLDLQGIHVQEFAVGETGRPINFYTVLQWMRICEQIKKNGK